MSVAEQIGPARRTSLLAQHSLWLYLIPSVFLLVFAYTTRADFAISLDSILVASGLLLIALLLRNLRRTNQEIRSAANVLVADSRRLLCLLTGSIDGVLIADQEGLCQAANLTARQLLGRNSKDQVIGHKVSSFFENPFHFERCWLQMITNRSFEGRAELLRPDGKHLPVRYSSTEWLSSGCHVLFFRDLRVWQDLQTRSPIDSAQPEPVHMVAQAMQDATLAITKDLRMGDLLTTFLETLLRFVPYEAAQILLTESTGKLFVAQEVLPFGEKGPNLHCKRTLNRFQYPVLHEALESKSGILVFDTSADPLWRTYAAGPAVRSWIGVRIASAQHTMGLIMLSHTVPGSFSPSHLKMTICLATTSALAVQKGRLLERSEIYAAELERCLSLSKSRQPEKS